MKVLVPLACLVIFSSAINTEFEAFKTKYGKIYRNAAEEELRQQVFEDNLETIANHNALHKQGKISFDLAINQFADLTAKEFAAKFNRVQLTLPTIPRTPLKNPTDSLPDSIDWRNEGCVSRVRDQGQCGDDCALCVADAVEGQYCIATGSLTTIDPQRIMECCGMGSCSGCLMDEVYECLVTLTKNPSTGVCGADALTGGAVVTGYVDILSGSEDALKNATATIGPIVAEIDASHASFQLYNSGVYYEQLCFENILDHGVLVVGYGTEGGEDYWLVKNSWGTSWGEQGYIKMSRNRGNNCAIATMASYPVVEV